MKSIPFTLNRLQKAITRFVRSRVLKKMMDPEYCNLDVGKGNLASCYDNQILINDQDCLYVTIGVGEDNDRAWTMQPSSPRSGNERPDNWMRKLRASLPKRKHHQRSKKNKEQEEETDEEEMEESKEIDGYLIEKLI